MIILISYKDYKSSSTKNPHHNQNPLSQDCMCLNLTTDQAPIYFFDQHAQPLSWGEGAKGTIGSDIFCNTFFLPFLHFFLIVFENYFCF